MHTQGKIPNTLFNIFLTKGSNRSEDVLSSRYHTHKTGTEDVRLHKRNANVKPFE